MKSKLVTLQEASQMLPLLKSIVLDIRSSWSEIVAKRTALESLEKEKTKPIEEDSDDARRVDELKAELNRLIERINNYICEVEELGCFVEEFKRGIVNFPSLYNGRKVFLCWALGDDDVGHWHELDESYNDRVKIQDPNLFLSRENRNPRVRRSDLGRAMR